ncbi:hypothetical protein O181_037582 [Austropuccinia psidii MF-1]|uniref:Uncharacterized protein n=1 Tax=Austropuccinia psidii MF-1 TaxID=1389203 RepID=A0A9Q3DD07_9BASI|nr:hypothetical protein [Austropuccinia psidii MF-1]
MDPTQNAWANATHQSGVFQENQFQTPQTHQQSITISQANHYEAVIRKLTNDLENLQATLASVTSQSISHQSKKPITQSMPSKPSKSNVKKAIPKPSPMSHQKVPSKVTSIQLQRASSAPPELMKQKTTSRKSIEKATMLKVPSSKRHPQQMQTGDFPPSFASTKTALFIHIKILWGLLKQDSVPKAPELRMLEEFYQKFTRPEQVENAIKTTANSDLSGLSQVRCFKDAHAGRIRFGKSVIHLGENFIRYAQGLMNQLGLRVWCPNLEEDASSLYNSAHRIAALTTFQELASTSAYAYLNIDPRMAMNMNLLIQGYNHFVHYLILNKYKKELKQEGNNSKEAAHKKISKNRERLRNERRDFAIINKFPKRYQDVLAPIGAHSDDEEVEGKGFYVIKTLVYRSRNANRFFRRLDHVMKEASEQDFLAKKSRRRVRRLPKTPIKSTYKAAPKGLPIDYYDPGWYHQLTPAQQNTIPNRGALAFLQNANDSLLPKKERHPDERLADSSFTRKYWEVLAEPYGLVGGESSSEDVEEEESASDDEGEGINLTHSIPDISDEEFLAEGDAGSLYDDNDDDLAEVEDEEVAEEDDEGQYEDYENQGHYVDEDLSMSIIPEEEGIWSG